MTAAAFVYAPDRRGEILRWSGAALLILLAHLAAGLVYQLHERTAAAQAEMPAIEIDLTPPQIEQPAPDVPMPPPAEDIKPEEPLPPEPQVMEQPQEPPPPELPPPEPEPEPVQAEQPLPEPPPPPKPVEVQPPKEPTIVAPPPKPVVKQAPRRPPPSPPKQATTAPKVGATSAGSAAGQADWKSRVIGILGRAKRYPSAAEARHETGTVQLSFTVDRSGRVTSRHIARSSGFAALDQEVLSMLDRVQLPAFPPEMPQPRMTLIAPVNFTLR